MTREPPDDRAAAVQLVTVEAEEADRRLDNFLLGRLKGVPRAYVYRIIRSGQVRINSRRASPDRRLVPGDRVRIPPVRRASPGRPALRADQANWIEQAIIYEDDDLLALDKPAGLAAHGGSGISLGAIELLRLARPAESGLGLVHRLDRETSGCMLVAKRHGSLRRVQAQFREGSIEKIYGALLLGELSGREHLVDAPLLTTERRGGERIVRVDPAGKTALSRFWPERGYPGCTLVRIGIVTGRTHQIRVHAAHLGHPVAGDQRYGLDHDPVVANFGLKRLFLHASSIVLQHPRRGGSLKIESPLPAELRKVLAGLSR